MDVIPISGKTALLLSQLNDIDEAKLGNYCINITITTTDSLFYV